MPPRRPRRPLRRGGIGFFGIIGGILAADVVSKTLAVRHLAPQHTPHEVLGEFVRLTLAYNPGAAFGMHLGPASRWIFAALSIVIVLVLLNSTRHLTDDSFLASIGVPIVVGGALGNLLDRVRFREGVVDFIDIGTPTWRFWTFNIADIAVTVGAICLILAIWREEQSRPRLAER